jgi:beta-lactamase class A
VTFGTKQQKQYCRLKKSSQIQWTLSDLATGRIFSSSENGGERFFGASASKIFVAAALLDKQHGEISKKQLVLMTRMIVRSDNSAWKELQRQAGMNGTDDSGREAVQAFVEKMGYENIRPFQGWMTRKDGSRVHGNELNSIAVAQFLSDTYHKRYPGAEILWKIMHATRTGRKKINKYTPREIYIAGKTGTYHGPNESRVTIKHAVIKARNHITVFNINDRHYGLSIFCNSGRDEDVAVLGGGLIREYLGVDKPVNCRK